MPYLNLTDHTRIQGAIVDAVLSREDHRAFVFTPADPLPARRIAHRNPERARAGDYSTAYWHEDGPTFTAIKRVQNWGWLRRITNGYNEPQLVHPAVGTAFAVRTWRYKPHELGKPTPRPIPHERIDGSVFIARLSDGRIFADRWASRSVLHDALSKWRNAQGYTVDWQEPGLGDPPTCAIGGLDWRTIPDLIAEHRRRVMRERELAS